MLELGLPFELVHVSVMKKEPWFLEINPRGKVPAIQNLQDGSVIYESAICDEYLCDYARQMDTNNNTDQDSKSKLWKLMPTDAADKAAMRLLNDHIDTQLGPAQYTFLMNDDKEKDAGLMDTLEDALQVLQDSLIQRGGPYLMGSHFTLAEAHVLPFFLRLVVSLQHFKDYQIPPQRFGRLLEWYELCTQRESFQTTAKSDETIVEVYQKFVDMKYGFGGLNKNKEVEM
ncbi:Probable glutathione [Seminavis robusta]|uniref:Probable glutathione n=1 Tax=Seminavis robusta TaxID=568900 RepID=A0A9N8H2C8_9STRA|nr:Probable glutathione [Seminavis robusta]|eukprot:Sro33_g021560.1 Probable glutathione (229) ;mRNA; f:107244-107930